MIVRLVSSDGELPVVEVEVGGVRHRYVLEVEAGRRALQAAKDMRQLCIERQAAGEPL